MAHSLKSTLIFLGLYTGAARSLFMCFLEHKLDTKEQILHLCLAKMCDKIPTEKLGREFLNDWEEGNCNYAKYGSHPLFLENILEIFLNACFALILCNTKN